MPTRRRFLKTLAAAGGGLTIASAGRASSAAQAPPVRRHRQFCGSLRDGSGKSRRKTGQAAIGRGKPNRTGLSSVKQRLPASGGAVGRRIIPAIHIGKRDWRTWPGFWHEIEASDGR